MSEIAAQAAGTVWQWRPRPQGEEAAARARAARQARKRGAIGGVIGLSAALVVSLWQPTAALVVAAIALAMTTLALASPLGGFRRVSGWLERFGYLVGLALTWILLPVVYWLLFVPVGLFLRATGKLRITRAPERHLASYWKPAPQRAAGLDSYRRPF